MGMGKSNQTSGSAAAFDENVWGGQQAALQGLYSNAAQLFGQTNAGMQGQIPGAVGYANNVANQAMPAWQQQMQGGAYAGFDPNTAYQSLTSGINNPVTAQTPNVGVTDDIRSAMDTNQIGQFQTGPFTQDPTVQRGPSNASQIYAQMMGGDGNSYADAMKEVYLRDANRTAGEAMNVLDARATGAGMGGSSRHGIAQGLAMRDINENLQKNLAQVGYDTFDKDLANKLSIAEQADLANLERDQMQFDRAAMLENQATARQGLNLQGGLGNQQYTMGMGNTLANLGLGQGNLQLGASGLNIQGDQNTLARQNMLTDILGQQNATQQGALNAASNIQGLGMGAMNPYMMPWNAANAYGTIVGPPTVLGSGDMSGSSSGRSKSASLPIGA